MPQRFFPLTMRVLLIFIGLWLVFELVAYLTGEILWFQEVGYLGSFLKRLFWQLGLLAITGGLSLWFLWGNLRLASRLQWQMMPGAITPQSRSLRLPLLLSLVLGFSFSISLLLLHYSQTAIAVWTPNFTLPNVTLPLPSVFDLNALPTLLPPLLQQFWQLGIIAVITLLILLKSQFWLRGIAVLLSLIFGIVMSGNWTRILSYLQATPFSQVDPQFGKDISFYVFGLPIWKLLDVWLGGLFFYGLVAVILVYLLSGDSLSQGKFPGFSRPQLRHLYALGGLLMLVLGLRHGRGQYELLYSPSGIVYGAGYTDIKVRLPVETILALLATAIAFWLFLKAFQSQAKRTYPRKFTVYLFCLYLTIIIAGFLATQVVQGLIVEPNELVREKPYIERSIASSRAAFNLDHIEERTLNGTGKLTIADLQKNRLTLNNIRLWDTRPLLQTNRQLQQIRLYYKFPDADIDRYTIKIEQSPSQIIPAQQQVLIAARELDYQAVPQQAKTWINQHLVYTHGYGFTVSPVNLVDQGGLPFYFVKDIGTTTERDALKTSSKLIRDSIPTDNPRLYYGELTNTYIMTNTKVKELDFPSGQDNVYNTYDGTGGIKIGSWERRLLFAQYLKDWQMLFTHNFTADTRLLFRRNINRRIREIAPFLQYDQNPYLVAVNTGKQNPRGEESYLYWIVDAYTTSDRYPYSDPGKKNFNYIRNSVKIVIDAYNGDVNFYIADATDPIIQTWSKIFPQLFKPLAVMPASLQQHIRYPEDLLRTQSESLLNYHMTDPQVFYNREDQWRIPQEIYGGKEQLVQPYYLIMKLTGTAEEFVLFHVYTPTSRNNLISFLFARSDGKDYGKLLLYQLPKQKLIYGPEQIEALINQDPVISQRISLWNREGSRVIQGNLLVIPIEESLLYVEPLYLEAEKNSLPTLVQVIVVYENQIIMADNLQKALQAVFVPQQSTTAPAIVRPLEESSP